MSTQREKEQRRNDVLNLPSEVLIKARNRLFSLGGTLKPRDVSRNLKSDKVKKNERLKNVKSDPEFRNTKMKHKSRVDDIARESRPRPLSVGAMKRYGDAMDFHCGSFPNVSSQRQFDSVDNNFQTRLIPQERVDEVQDTIERPRKKLSFREPEIVNSACDTIGSSHKLVGVNSLPRRPNRISLRSDMQSSLHDLESELESQAMRIVRTVGQAFEVCHKMQANSTDPAAPSTSSAGDDLYERGSDAAANKEPASECGVSESAASTSKAAEEKHSNQNRPTHLELLPPPPRSDRKRSQHPASAPSINLPDLPECVTKVDESAAPVNDVTTPLSAQHQLQLLRERLDQQSQQTQAAVAQLLLMRDQLAAEQAARCEAQARTHQLLVHNKELLEHIAALVSHLQDREKGNSRPISTQQLTMLPQSNLAGGGEALKNDTAACNGNKPQNHEDALINLLTQNNNILNNMENNNVPSPHTSRSSGLNTASKFDGTNNELIQNYLSAKLQEVVFTQKNDTNAMNKQYFQNCNAFPNIPPLNNHFSNSDLASLLTQQIYTENLKLKDELNNITRAMSASHLQSSMNCDSQTSSSKDSSPDGSSSDDSMTFIMPLSHKGTLKATDDDGKVRLIVPVSPSESAAQVSTEQEDDCKPVYGATLKVPADVHVQAPPAPITRSTSEKVPNRSEMMTALRSQWTRHTTK